MIYKKLSNEQIKQLTAKYSPLVKWLFESNQICTNIDETIRWCLVWDDNTAITAAVNRTTNVISVNLAFINEAYNSNKIYDIEHFLLHEMRHVYQHIQIKKYESKENTVGEEYIKQWIKESNSYIPSIDKEGKENVGYSKQDCELDAYAFSFAIMHIKYHDMYDSLLYMPEIYKNELKEEFDSALKDFLKEYSSYCIYPKKVLFD